MTCFDFSFVFFGRNLHNVIDCGEDSFYNNTVRKHSSFCLSRSEENGSAVSYQVE